MTAQKTVSMLSRRSLRGHAGAPASAMRASSSASVAIHVCHVSTSIRASRRGGEANLEDMVVELCAERRRLDQDARQDEVAPPGADVDDELIGVPRQGDLAPWSANGSSTDRTNSPSSRATVVRAARGRSGCVGSASPYSASPSSVEHRRPITSRSRNGALQDRDRRERLLDHGARSAAAPRTSP